MEFSSLVLNESTLAALPEAKRPVYVYEWLRFLARCIEAPTADRKQEVRADQKKLVEQLMAVVAGGGKTSSAVAGPPARKLVAHCLTTLFRVGDTFLLFETINKCNDLLKNRDDSPSFLPIRLAAIRVLGEMYETLGRMTGRSYEETVQVLNKGLKNAESQVRTETMVTFGKLCSGLGSAASSVHRDVYKTVRASLSDRVMAVREAGAYCLLCMAPYAQFVTSTELENVGTMCFRAFDGANYETRKAIAKTLGGILAMTQQTVQYLYHLLFVHKRFIPLL